LMYCFTKLSSRQLHTIMVLDTDSVCRMFRPG
jgi:hypothetical protein